MHLLSNPLLLFYEFASHNHNRLTYKFKKRALLFKAFFTAIIIVIIIKYLDECKKCNKQKEKKK